LARGGGATGWLLSLLAIPPFSMSKFSSADGPILSGEWTNISEVIRSFPMGGGTVVLQNLCPGGQTRMRIYSHDPATNARHTNHVGIVNELLVTGGEYDANGQLVTAQLANNITLTAAGAHPGPAGLQMWDGVEMRADVCHFCRWFYLF